MNYHILMILTDGLIDDMEDTKDGCPYEFLSIWKETHMGNQKMH